MPRQVDHDQRRREIIEALWSLTISEGLTAVSFRKVAAEAGVSVRRIQYYFGDKATLLRQALQLVGEQVVADGLAAVGEVGPDPTIHQLLRAIIGSALPTDDRSRSLSLLFFSFHVAAITDPNLASAEAGGTKNWTVPFAAKLIAQAREQGGTRPGIEPDQEALMLMSAFHGLSLDVVAGNRTGEEAMAAIDYRLDRIFNRRRTRPQLPDMSDSSPDPNQRRTRSD